MQITTGCTQWHFCAKVAESAAKLPVSIEWDSHVFCAERIHSLDHSQSQLESVCNFWHLRDCTCVEREPVIDVESRMLASRLAKEDPVAACSFLHLDCRHFYIARAPFVVGQCLGNLADLEIIAQIPASLQLAPLVVRAVSVDLIVPDQAAFEAGFEHLYLCWSNDL
jgi:hypothetical protein